MPRTIGGVLALALVAALAAGAPAVAADASGTELALDSTPNLIQVKGVEADPPETPLPAEPPKAPAAKAKPAPAPVVAPATTAPNVAPQAPGALRQLTDAGGWAMYGIFACAIAVILFGIERGLALRAGKVLPGDFVRNVGDLASMRPADREKILTYCVASPSPAARIFHATVRGLDRGPAQVDQAIRDTERKEARALRFNCRAISGAALVAVLVGLLGAATTLLGHTMDASAGASALPAETLYRAMVPVAAGLAVAVVAAVLYLVLVARIERLVAEIEDLALELAETLEGRPPSGKPQEKGERTPLTRPGGAWNGPAKASA